MASFRYKIRIQYISNKSRKGDFLYIKRKGKPSRLYKLRKDSTINAYKKMYELSLDKKISKSEKVRTIARIRREIVKAPKRKVKKIAEVIEKGIESVTIDNAYVATKKLTNRAYKKLLKPLVSDNSLLNILVKEENMKKVKLRFEHKIEFISGNGETIGTTSKVGDTIEEAVFKMQNLVKRGEYIRDEYLSGLAEKIKGIGYNKYEHLNNGKVAKIRIKTIFRKGN